MLLQGSPAQKADLEQLLKDQQDPASPQYHKWLTPAQFGQRFGPSQNDIAAVTGWLTSQGFSVEKPSNGRQFLLFTGTSAQVESAFQTQMHRYAVNGKTHFGNATAASVPAALAPVVTGVASLNSFNQFRPQSYPAANPLILAGQYIFTGPADLAAIYDAAPLQKAGVEGQGQSIALIEESDFSAQDLADFRTLAGLPPAKVNVIQNGPDPGLLASDGEEFEAIADVEYAGALDPDVTVNFIVTASTEFNQGIDLSTVYAVDYAVSPVTSMSYGGCETINNTYGGSTVSLYAYAYEQGAAEGISHFVSSGDNGGDDCLYLGLSAGYGVNALGDSPWNVSAGGTEFIMPDPYVYFAPPNYTATGYIPESAWNDYENPYDGRSLAGNGGVSINFTKPDWQTGPGVPADGQRDTPDVSLLAADNLAYLTCEADIGLDCSAGNPGGVIGTSLASPNWAAIQTLVNQKNNLIGGAGNPNPTYYRLAAGANSPFHDITAGDTKVPDPDEILIGYIATPGYDLATGLGSVDVNKLATNWLPPTGTGAATVTLSTTAATITHGDPLTANVAVTSSGSTTPTGDIALMAGTQGVVQITLASGTSSFPFGASSGVELPGGTYNLTAHYAGDTNFAPATSNKVALTVNPEPTVTQGLFGGTVYYGTAVTLAGVAVGTNSGTQYPVPGTYTFSENGVTLGTGSLADTGEGFSAINVGTTASTTLSGAKTLAAGTHQIVVASPPATASFAASTSTPVSLVVVPSGVLVSLAPNHTTPAVNSTVNLVVSVVNLNGANVPVSGMVGVQDTTTSATFGPVALATKPDSTGAFDATLPATFTTTGVHTLIATYSGDASNLANLSGAVNVTVGVGKSATTTTIGGQSFGLAGNAVTVTANVAGDSSGAAPTGTITFTDTEANKGAGAVVGTATLGSNGSATLTTKTLSDGYHLITATYPGDTNYAASASFSIQVYIGDFTLTASPSTASAVAGQSTSAVTLTYTGSQDFSSITSGPGITLACSGLPTGAACNFSTTAIVPSDNSDGTTTGAATVTISTTGPLLSQASLNRPRNPWEAKIPMALAGLFVLGLPLAFRRRRLFTAFLGLALLAVLGSLTACNKNNGPNGQYNVTNPGTAAGTSTVTVTATLNTTSGALAHTAPITLTVTADGAN
jgi:subtilase family serine protease